MANEKGYNGWSNYETWNLALWFGNDQGSQEFWEERAQAAWNDTDEEEERGERKSEATLVVAKELKETIEEESPQVTGFYADILNAAIREVNWYEIAEHYMENVDKSGTV